MRALKIILIIIAVMVVLFLLAAVIFMKTFDINRYKPQIISRASDALGRPVDFKKATLGISLRQGASLRVTGLRIAEDPAFGEGDFLAVKGISFGIDVLGFIFHKKVNVPSVLIDSPRLTLIRSGDGSVNINKLGRLKEKEREISVPSLAAFPALFISSVKATGGTITYIDRLFEPPLKFEINNLEVTATKISLTKSFPFTAEAAVLSRQKNVFLEGEARLDLQQGEATISGLKGTAELSRILWEEIPVYFPMAKNLILPNDLKGEAAFSLKEMTVGAKGLSDLSADVSLKNATLQFKEVASDLQEVTLEAKITEKNILFETISARLGEGRIDVSGAIEDYFLKQNYKMQVRAENINLADLIVRDKSGVKLEGIASCQLTLNGEGFSPSNINSNLSGQAEMNLLKPALKDINVLRTVLDKISVIPRLAQKIEASLPERFRQKMTQKDTVFSDVKIPLTIANGRLSIKDILLGTDEFTFSGRGEAGFDAAFILDGAFLIPQDLSQAMISAVGQLQYLLNKDNQIYLPLKVSGNARELKFSVDAAYIAQKLLAEQGKEQLFKLIDKTIGSKEESAPPSSEQDIQKEQGPQEKEPGPEEKVKDILQQIFR